MAPAQRHGSARRQDGAGLAHLRAHHSGRRTDAHDRKARRNARLRRPSGSTSRSRRQVRPELQHQCRGVRRRSHVPCVINIADRRERRTRPRSRCSLRYQACTDKRVPAAQKATLTAKFNIDPKATACRSRDARRVSSSSPARRSPALPAPAAEVASRTNRGSGEFSAGRVRLRTGGDLHALRVPDDPDHAVVLPEQTRSSAAGDPVLPRHRCACSPDMGLPVTAASGSVRGRAAWVESLGERVYRDWCSSSSA